MVARETDHLDQNATELLPFWKPLALDGWADRVMLLLPHIVTLIARVKIEVGPNWAARFVTIVREYDFNLQEIRLHEPRTLLYR